MNISTLPAVEQAARVKSGALRAVDLLAHYQARIDRWNPELHAFVQTFPERALRDAGAVDKGPARGAICGVPFAIKDTDPVRGAWNRAGSRAYRYVWSPVDAPQVSRLRASGVVLTGKTATSELALMPVVETDLQPPTTNPWSLAHSAGGSSGGAAAAVAGGLLPVAHAADGGGSIRIPAALCHLYGFKASRGLMPHYYGAFDKVALSVAGAVSHTVADTAAVLDALCGRPEGTEAGALSTRLEEAPTGLRVGLCLEAPTASTLDEIAVAVEQIGRVLEGLGHHLFPLSTFEGSLDEFLPIYQRLAANPPALSESHLQPVTRWLRQGGRKVTAAHAQAVCDRIEARLRAWSAPFDLVLTPTVGQLAPAIGAFRGSDGEAAFRAAAALGAFTAGFNASGQPAASVPAGVGAGGLPMGAQLIGAHGADALVLQVSRQLERTLQWTSRRSPVFLEGLG